MRSLLFQGIGILFVRIFLILWFLSIEIILIRLASKENRYETAWRSIYKVRDSGNPEEDTATFILPGFLSPSIEKFQPYIDSLPGDVYFCEYSGTFWSEKSLADRIVEIIRSNPYKKVELLSISFGCKVAYNLTTFSGIAEDVEIKSVMLCPMPRGRMMQARLRVPLMIGLPLITPVVFLSGPFINVQFIKFDGVSHSLLELLTQAFSIVYDARPCILGMRGEGRDEIVISAHDSLVDNAGVYEALGHKDFRLIIDNFGHGDIGDDLCYFAVQRAGAFDDF